MPLHDWTDERGWDSVHPLWLTYLLEHVQERLPEGYKAFLGGVPSLTVDSVPGKPDVSVRQWGAEPAAEPATSGTGVLEPDLEASVPFPLAPPARPPLLFPRATGRPPRTLPAAEQGSRRRQGGLLYPVPGLPAPGRSPDGGRCVAAPEGLLVLGRHHRRPGPATAAA